MATIEKKGDQFELNGKRLYSSQMLKWTAPDGVGTMPVVFKISREGAPQLWCISMPLLVEGQERLQRTGEVPLADDALVLVSGDPLTANLDWIR
jgi:hypothetical protein